MHKYLLFLKLMQKRGYDALMLSLNNTIKALSDFEPPNEMLVRMYAKEKAPYGLVLEFMRWIDGDSPAEANKRIAAIENLRNHTDTQELRAGAVYVYQQIFTVTTADINEILGESRNER